MEKGGISVSTEHIFPVIKRWLYSDKDIFIREAVSNACDAVTKYKRLVSLGETEEVDSDYKVEVKIDKEAKTITVSDNGIGMTAEEVKKYINQIALSGALEFIEKYEGENDGKNGIIGHFGLGFYSVFMVAEKVLMTTKSYLDEAAVLWECDESGSFSMSEGIREKRGTEIVLHVSDDEIAYLDKEKLRGILEKYCSYMPYPIMFGENNELETINETAPLWQKQPQDAAPDEYNEFYKKMFSDFADPLAYIHINADYPLNFKGILYFSKVKNDYEVLEPKINLYYNSVFVADNIKDVVPEYFLNVKGVLDCPELPLNVSRSYLQSNSYMTKVSQHIAKKIADKFNGMFQNQREEYEKIYPDVSAVLQYSCMRDSKLYDRLKESIIFKKTGGGFASISELLDGKDEGELYYTVSGESHDYYVNLYTQKGYQVLELNKMIDTQFVQFLESKNDKIKFKRIDSALDVLNENNESNESDKEILEKIFTEVSGKKSEDIIFVSLGENDAPALSGVTEESRRMSDMMRAYGLDNNMPGTERLIINLNNPAIKHIKELNEEKQALTAKQIYLSALILTRKLTADEQNEFIRVSTEILKSI